MSETNQIMRFEWIVCESKGLLLLARRGIVVRAEKKNESNGFQTFQITEPKIGIKCEPFGWDEVRAVGIVCS